MIRTTCANCPAELRRAGRGRPQTYCSARCRVAAHRKRREEDAFPAQMRQESRWVRRGEDKAPVRADTGCPASSTDPRTWCDHDSAARSPYGTGPGFVLNGDGIVCIDLDHALVGDELTPWAAAILAACPPTYTEISPSGTGLHLWGYGHVARGRRIRRDDGAHIEVYGTGRYIALGRRYGQAPAELADLSEVITSLTA